MELRLETPPAEHHYEHWATIMERVTGDVFSVEELAHVFETDRGECLGARVRGDEPAGCGVGRPSSVAGSLYAMVRVLPEHRRQGIGSTLYGRSRGTRAAAGSLRCGAGSGRTTPSHPVRPNRGFGEVGREFEVVLDVTKADLAASRRPGTLSRS